MEDSKKILLVNILQLGSKLMNNNFDVTSEINAINNNDYFDNDKINQIQDIFIRLLENTTINNYQDQLTNIINSIDKIDKNFCLSYMQLRNISFSDKQDIKTKLTNILDSNISFNNVNNEYQIYSMLVNLAIPLNDKNLLIKAINKIQSL